MLTRHDRRPSAPATVKRTRTLDAFLLRQINAGLAKAHAAAQWPAGSPEWDTNRRLARFKYQRLIWFLSQIRGTTFAAGDDVQESMSHLEAAVAALHDPAAPPPRKMGQTMVGTRSDTSSSTTATDCARSPVTNR